MNTSADMEKIKNLFSQHNFVMTTAELTVAKLYYADIQKMLNEGLIEKVKRGYYHWIDKDNSSGVHVYDRGRTICDVLKNMNKMDKEVFNKAVQNYVKDPKKSIPNLMKYAKELRVQKRVKDLIGVWL